MRFPKSSTLALATISSHGAPTANAGFVYLIDSHRPAARHVSSHRQNFTPSHGMQFSSDTSSSLSATARATDGDDSGSSRLFEEELNIIYDSKCNVCKLEIDFLARRDAKRGGGQRKLKMTDLESDDYNPDDPANGQVSYAKGMAAIHAVTADGRVMEGVPVFSAAYQQVGLGWLFKFTEWPVFKTIAKWGYNVFAKYRTNITRGSSIEDLVAAYEAKLALQKNQETENCQTCPPSITSTRQQQEQ